NTSERATLGQRIFPEFVRRTRVRIATRHADDGYCWSHLTPPSQEQKPATVNSKSLGLLVQRRYPSLHVPGRSANAPRKRTSLGRHRRLSARRTIRRPHGSPSAHRKRRQH